MKKTYSPVAVSVVRLDSADVLTASDATVKENEQYFNGEQFF